MDGDTTEEDISLPSSTGSSLTGNMSGLASDDVLVVPGETEKLVHSSTYHRACGIVTNHHREQGKSMAKDQDYYFNFYSSLQNQYVPLNIDDHQLKCRANMIGDISRTGTYRKAILGNSAIAFNNKNVLDLGAGMLSCLVMLISGSGILSFISAQAGAKQVIALEASSMADKMAVVSLIFTVIRGILITSS
jgi:hypothetical protein